MLKILVLNLGSTSFKFKLYEMGEAENLHEYRFCLVQRHRPLFLGLEPEERV